jgi:phosphatidylinositol glycan class C protein
MITASLCSISVYLLTPLSTLVTALCVFVLFSITFIAPMLLVWAQQYKK